MMGAIIGDVVGSVYEFRPVKFKDFPLFSNRFEKKSHFLMYLRFYRLPKLLVPKLCE